MPDPLTLANSTGLEQPARHSTLMPRALEATAVLDARTLIGPIDPHTELPESNRLAILARSVT